MTTKTMTVIEEVYHYIEEREEMKQFDSVHILEVLSWNSFGAVSAALGRFEEEGRIIAIGVVGNRKIFTRTLAFKDERAFYKAGPLGKHYNRRSGYSRKNTTKKLPKLDEGGKPIQVVVVEKHVDRNLLLKRLYDIAEQQLNLAAELEELRNLIKDKLIL